MVVEKPTEQSDYYTILKAYHKPTEGSGKIWEAAWTFGGLALLVYGMINQKTALVIGGGTMIGTTTLYEGIEYAKAYMEARLDYLANNKFTRLEKGKFGQPDVD